MEYKYYKFKGGRYFRTTDEEHFDYVSENNMWEEDDLIYFVFIDSGLEYDEITDPILLEKLKSLPVKEKKLNNK